MRKKDDAAEALKGFLADNRTDEDVEIVWPHGGGEVRGMFSKLCVDKWIEQGVTTPDTPLYNERRVGGRVCVDRDELIICVYSGGRTFPDRIYPKDGISLG